MRCKENTQNIRIKEAMPTVEIIDKEKFKEEYKKVSSVYCPFLKTNVAFNGKGLNHVFFQGNRRERDFNDMQTRMRMFDRAVRVLKLVNTNSGYACDYRGSKPIYYWEFTVVMDNRRIKVVVRQLGDGGNKHFWSVIPKWRTTSDGRIINSGGRINF